MKNKYQSVFNVNLSSYFFMAGFDLGIVDIPKLLKFSKDELYKTLQEDIIKYLSEYKYIRNGECITIRAEWNKIIPNFEMNKQLPLIITVESDEFFSEDLIVDYAANFVELYLYDLFLISNISIPGSISLYNVNYMAGDFKEEFNIDNYLFSVSLRWCAEHAWPTIQYIPIKQVLTWYKKLAIGTRQVSQKSIERVVFAVLHICNETWTNPSGLIWLAHALETLFSSPNGMISKTLVSRIFLTLSEPKTNSKKIKKMIQEFYDLRSRFVHGDFNIHHPALNDVLDDNITDYTSKINEAEQVAFTIVLATIQSLIKNDWVKFSFSESYEGCKME